MFTGLLIFRGMLQVDFNLFKMNILFFFDSKRTFTGLSKVKAGYYKIFHRYWFY